MGTDTDNPQERAKSKHVVKNNKKQLTIIKTLSYQLIIDEEGQYYRCDLIKRQIAKITDEQAKTIMLNRLHECSNI